MIIRIAKYFVEHQTLLCAAIRSADMMQLASHAHVLHMLAVLSRFPRNRSALRKSEVHTHVVTVANAILQEMETSTRPLQDEDDTEPALLLVILEYCIECIVSYLDCQQHWKRLSSRDEQRPQEEAGVDCNIITAIVSSLRVVRSLSVSSSLIVWFANFQLLLLNALVWGVY